MWAGVPHTNAGEIASK
jgi:hypothetical protein